MTDWEYQRIPIDFDVYKVLTGKLRSPLDTYNDVLRRELQIPERVAAPDLPRIQTLSRRSWTTDGVEFPHGTVFRANHKGQQFRASIEDGVLIYDGQKQTSLSRAAIAVTKGPANGWKFWQCQLPGKDTWVVADRLRSKREEQ